MKFKIMVARINSDVWDADWRVYGRKDAPAAWGRWHTARTRAVAVRSARRGLERFIRVILSEVGGILSAADVAERIAKAAKVEEV
jgi:hypothetical protein